MTPSGHIPKNDAIVLGCMVFRNSRIFRSKSPLVCNSSCICSTKPKGTSTPIGGPGSGLEGLAAEPHPRTSSPYPLRTPRRGCQLLPPREKHLHHQRPVHLQQAIDNIQIVIDIFNRLGMRVNVKKSAILFDLKGSDAKKILKHHLVKQQGSMSLKVHQLGETALIPILKQHDYLGTIIAFRDPATLNLN